MDHTKPIDKLDLMFATFEAKNSLDALFSGSVFAGTLRSTRPLAVTLQTLLERINAGEITGDAPATDVWALKSMPIPISPAEAVKSVAHQ